MDEVFGSENFVSLIAFKKTSGELQTSSGRAAGDYLIVVREEQGRLKYRQLYSELKSRDEGDSYL